MNQTELLNAYSDYLSGNKSKFQILADNLIKDQIYDATRTICERYKSYDGHYVLSVIKLLTRPFED